MVQVSPLVSIVCRSLKKICSNSGAGIPRIFTHPDDNISAEVKADEAIEEEVKAYRVTVLKTVVMEEIGRG